MGQNPPISARIVVTPEGWSKHITRAGKEAVAFTVRWKDIAEVVAWKDDQLITDCINLGFRVRGGSEFLAADEEEDGWVELMEALPRELPGFARPEWYLEMMTPAFETGWTTLWGEASDPSQGSVRRA